MRPRFSLRVILVVVAVVAGALYFGCVRPTMVAQRFVAAVMRRDDAAASQMVGDERWQAVVHPKNGIRADWMYAELVLREWADWWRCERHVLLRVLRHSDLDGGYRDWTEDSDVVVGPVRVRIRERRRTVHLVWPDRGTGVSPVIINPGEGSAD